MDLAHRARGCPEPLADRADGAARLQALHQPHAQILRQRSGQGSTPGLNYSGQDSYLAGQAPACALDSRRMKLALAPLNRAVDTRLRDFQQVLDELR